METANERIPGALTAGTIGMAGTVPGCYTSTYFPAPKPEARECTWLETWGNESHLWFRNLISEQVWQGVVLLVKGVKNVENPSGS